MQGGALLRECGDPGTALHAAKGGGAWPWEAVLEELRRARAFGLPRLSPAYPERLARLADAALLLLVQGHPELLSQSAVAIVGARAPTAYGRTVAQRLAYELARAGLVIVSGLAHGIDAAAHAGALEAGGRTVAVQACGPDQVYPPSHRRLAARIAETGALVTEFPPGTPPRAAHFPLRNRMISGLARAVVVVEARQRSGSLVTARHALDQGVEVLAVPGPIMTPTSAGPNQLLRDGAVPVLEVEDILRAVDWPLPERAAESPGAQEIAAGAALEYELSPGGRRIARALSQEPATRDELVRRLNCSAQELAAELLALELEGWVQENRDGRLLWIAPVKL